MAKEGIMGKQRIRSLLCMHRNRIKVLGKHFSSCSHVQRTDFGSAIVIASAFHLWDRGFNSHCGRMISYVKESVDTRGKSWVFSGYSGFLLTG